MLAAADPAQPYGAALPWPKRAGARAARVAGAHVVLLGGEAALFVERGGRSLVPLRDPDEDWLRPALAALVAHVRRGGAKRLAVERFDGEPVTETRRHAAPRRGRLPRRAPPRRPASVSLHAVQEASYRRASAGIAARGRRSRLSTPLSSTRFSTNAATACSRRALPVAARRRGPSRSSRSRARSGSPRARAAACRISSARPGCRWSSPKASAISTERSSRTRPVTIASGPPDGLLDAWEVRFGTRAEWAVAWLELRPERVYSYAGA